MKGARCRSLECDNDDDYGCIRARADSALLISLMMMLGLGCLRVFIR